MALELRIHPAIGLARLGDSPDAFCISPEARGELPIACDERGTVQRNDDDSVKRITRFKDERGRIKRQAARFRIFVYDGPADRGHELTRGEVLEFVHTPTGQRITARVADIEWTVYVANKKACWYEFRQLEGEHGYAPDHPRRNADITDDDDRQRLIIDPGPFSVRHDGPERASLARGANPWHPQSFPPPLHPKDIDTLGDLLLTTDEEHSRLLVLGGFGHSGSLKEGFGEPRITHYANNDGWFDDTADGSVTARLHLEVQLVNGRPPTAPYGPMVREVDVPAWVVVGYPGYAPEIADIIGMDETMHDVAVRELAADVELFGVPPFDGTQRAPTNDGELAVWRAQARFNPDYTPHFWRDVWPILERPDAYKYVLNFDPLTGGVGGDAHNKSPGNNFDVERLCQPPAKGRPPAEEAAFRNLRQFIYAVLRKPDQANLFTAPIKADRPTYLPRLMPDLCGDNPITNTGAEKFLRLTETQLFVLGQWAAGKFVNERQEAFEEQPAAAGAALDTGVIANALGGSFCPGAEIAWIVRNPAIYSAPLRIRHRADVTPGSLSQGCELASGLEPGDLTRYSAVPWQADFNECSTQDVDITAEAWNKTYPESIGDPRAKIIQTTFWWPSHRPWQVSNADGTNVRWTEGIPASNAGDLMMVTKWKDLGFVARNPDPAGPAFIQVERNESGE